MQRNNIFSINKEGGSKTLEVIILNISTVGPQYTQQVVRTCFAGVGPPLSPERTRTMLALRINVLAKGYSGISLKVLKQYMDAFNGRYGSSYQLQIDFTLLTCIHAISQTQNCVLR